MNKIENKTGLTGRDFFFCYSPHLARFINEQGIRYITVAKNVNTDQTFSLFYSDDKLKEVIEQYRQRDK